MERAAAPTIYFKIDADGTTNMSKLDLPDELAATGKLGAKNPVAQSNAMRTLRVAIGQEVASETIARDDRGIGNGVLSLTVDGRTDWRYVQWVLQLAAEAKQPTIDLGDPRGGAPLRIVLPTDRGIEEEEVEEIIEGEIPGEREAGPDVPGKVKVRVFRRGLQLGVQEQYTLIKLGHSNHVSLPKGPEANQDDAYWKAMRKLRDLLAKRIDRDKPGTFELDAPPPKGGSVPYFDVFRILRMARDLGQQQMLLSGAALPLGR